MTNEEKQAIAMFEQTVKTHSYEKFVWVCEGHLKKAHLLRILEEGYGQHNYSLRDERKTLISKIWECAGGTF